MAVELGGDRTTSRAGRRSARATSRRRRGYLQLQQSDATEEALLAAIGERPAQGAQDVGGARWVVYGARPAEPVWIADVKGVRLVLTGSATDDEFRTLATAVLARDQYRCSAGARRPVTAPHCSAAAAPGRRAGRGVDPGW